VAVDVAVDVEVEAEAVVADDVSADAMGSEAVVTGTTTVMDEVIEQGAPRWWPSSESAAGGVDVLRRPERVNAASAAAFDADTFDADTAVGASAAAEDDDGLDVEAFDVEAESSVDDEEAAKQRLIEVVDALLYVSETSLNAAGKRLEQFTPPTEEEELARPWARLRSLGGEARLEWQRSTKAQLTLADALQRLLDRQ